MSAPFTLASRPAADWAGGAAHVDGAIVPIAEARIPITDLGFLHSDATYDVVHVWRGRFFRLPDHLDRFFAGMQKLRLSLPYNRTQVRTILAACVRASGLQDAYVEMVCTRGIARAGSRDPRDCENRFYAFAVPFAWVATPAQQDAGVSLHISRVQRIAPESVDPSIKNYHWLDLIRAQYEAYDAHAQLAVLVDRQDNVVEGAGFNIFTVVGNTVTTPAAGMLRGITRRTALELARDAGLVTCERPVHARELARADEVFLTSTAGGIIPVRTVDGRLIGTGEAPVAQRLRQRYWQAHDDPRLSEPV